MRYAEFKWPAPFVVAAVMAGTAAATVEHVRLLDLLLDSGTGVLAGLGAVVAGTRLAVGDLGGRGRFAWQFALAALIFVALGELCEPFSTIIEQRLGIDDFDDLLLLAVAPVALWFLARIEPLPLRPQRWVVAGFALQVLATVLDFIDDGQAASSFAAARIATYADFTQVLSIWAYVMALSWVAFYARQGLLAGTGRDALVGGVSGERRADRQRPIRGRLYPPPFMPLRGLPAGATPAVRVRRLCNEALWPTHDPIGTLRNVALIASWPLVAGVRAWQALKVHGERVQWMSGKTKVEQFLEQIGLAVCHRMPPSYYYVYELYRPGHRRRAGDYLLRDQTKEIAYRLLYPAATWRKTPAPLADKAAFTRHCLRHGLRHVPTLMMFESGQRVADRDFMHDLPQCDLFVKRASGKGGDTERWRYLGDGRFTNLRGDWLHCDALMAHVARLSVSEPHLIQLAVANHRGIEPLSAGSLAMVRLLSCRNELGDFEVTNAALRMAVDPRSLAGTFQADGIAAPVDIATGELGFATDLGDSPDTEWHERHPFTGAMITGTTLPMWQETIDLAVRAHRAFSDHVVVGWDIAILEDGPCLVGGSCRPDIDIIQRTLDGPVGNGRFGQLLAYHIERRRNRQS